MSAVASYSLQETGPFPISFILLQRSTGLHDPHRQHLVKDGFFMHRIIVKELSVVLEVAAFGS